MRPAVRFITAVGILAALTFGAGAQRRPLQIVASFSILADVVRNVTLNTAQVTSLIPVGADPHSFEPSARDIAALADADVIFVAGAKFEESLLAAISNTGSDAVIVEASACVPMRTFGMSRTDAVDTEPAATASEGAHQVSAFGFDLNTLCSGYDAYIAELDTLKADMGFPSGRVPDIATLGRLFEADCAGSGAGADQTEAEHDSGACDPHVWSDPRNVYYWTLYVRDVLSTLDPDNAETFAANEQEYLYAIDDMLRLDLVPLLAEIPDQNRKLVTNHDTLGYFAAAYGFETAGFVLPGGSAMAEPSAQDIAALIELVHETGVSAIFAESTLSSQVADQIASEAGVAVYTLFTDSLSDENGPASTYLDYIAYNFTTIATALTPR